MELDESQCVVTSMNQSINESISYQSFAPPAPHHPDASFRTLPPHGLRHSGLRGGGHGAGADPRDSPAHGLSAPVSVRRPSLRRSADLAGGFQRSGGASARAGGGR